MSGTFTMNSNEMYNPSFNDRIPAEIAENFREFFAEHDALSYEEFLQQQESLYQSVQMNGKINHVASQPVQTSYWNHSAPEGEASHSSHIDSQLALDEALARSMQELGDDFESLYIDEHRGTATDTRESATRETPERAMNQNTRQDDVDPDNMTYEELQSLGEAVGQEGKGLSEIQISRLRTSKYKTGFFSKKKKETCVICFSEFKSGDRLMNLPCVHQYHSECISRWLKLNKNCPVCQKEVRL